MLKKSLIALAIASVAGSAFAVELNVGNDVKDGVAVPHAVSIEGRAIASEIKVEGFTVTLGAEYTLNDEFTLTFNNVKFANDFQFADSIKKEAVPAVEAEGETPAKPAKKEVTLGKLSQTENSVTYRVTSIGDEGVTRGIELNIGDVDSEDPLIIPLIKFDAKSFTASQASVKFSAKTNNGSALDTANNDATLFVAKQQLVASIAEEDKLDGIVDVDKLRLGFTVGVKDSVKFTLVDHKGATEGKDKVDLLAVDLGENSKTFQLNGDFSFLDTKPEEEGITTKAGAVVVEGEGLVPDSLKVEADKITFKSTSSTPTLTINVSGEKETEADAPIATQVFTAEVRTDYSVDGKEAKDYVIGTNLAAGQWTLNGAVVHVPYMPFRPGFSPIVNVSNTSQQDGAIEVIVYAKNDNAWVTPKSYQLDITAKAQAQTDITAALRAQGIEGDVAFDIIVNAPKDAVHANALYFHNGDRAVINTVKKN